MSVHVVLELLFSLTATQWAPGSRCAHQDERQRVFPYTTNNLRACNLDLQRPLLQAECGCRQSTNRFVPLRSLPCRRWFLEGMDHGVYGPADQGAYNRFYAGYFDVHLKASWNWKPYWGHLDYTGRAANVSLVHFHGPKPHEYFAHEASKKSMRKGRGRDPFHVLFDLCDMRDRKSAALIPRQPGCMAFSHRYREELAKVGPLVRSAVVA